MASPQRTPEFRAEAVRIALTSGLPRKQVASDLGVGFSTLSRWIQADQRNPEKSTAQTDMGRRIWSVSLLSFVARTGCFGRRGTC